MAKKICPIMSRPMATVGAYDQPTISVEWVDCQENNCKLWSSVYTTENLPISGCSLELNAHKNQDGKYVV